MLVYDYTFIISGNMDGIGLDSSSKYHANGNQLMVMNCLIIIVIKKIGLNIHGSPFTPTICWRISNIYNDTQCDKIWQLIKIYHKILIY